MSVRVPQTGFVPPVRLGDGLKATIEYEFVNKVEGHVFHCE